MFEFSDQAILTLIQGIFDGEITDQDLPENLYMAIAKVLKQGLYEGVKGSLNEFKLGSIDRELVEELRANIYMFSAAKTYQEVRDMTDALVDEEGNLQSFAAFKEAAAGIFTQYNETYLQAEYDTAIGQGAMGMQWNKIIDQKEVLPLLKYTATVDELVCDICGPLDGVVAKVDDPIWDEFYPENHFRCRCTVEQLEEDEAKPSTEAEKDMATEQVRGQMSPVFLMNAGKDQYVFSPDHPYFNVAPKDVDFAKRNFDLPIPATDAKNSVARFIEAATVKEAESRILDAGVRAVSLKGMTVPMANSVLEAVETESSFGRFELKGLSTFNKAKSDASAYYYPSTQEIKINLSNIKKFKEAEVEPFPVQIKRFQDLIEKFKAEYLGNAQYNQTTVRGRISVFQTRIRTIERRMAAGETPKPWTVSSNQKTLEKSLKSTVTHEIGHYRHYETLGLKTKFSSLEADSVSDYGRTNNKEYFAEWFSQYRMHGPEGVPEDILKLFKQIDNGK